MTSKPRSVVHGTFTIERTYPAPPERVYAAWADPKIKAKWFTSPPDWIKVESKTDFRVGHGDVDRGGPKGGPVISFFSRYQDIVPNERIIYTYDILFGDDRISVSVATIEFKAAGKGTKLVLTEQGAYLDGLDNPKQREEGTHQLLNQLDAELKRQTAN